MRRLFDLNNEQSGGQTCWLKHYMTIPTYPKSTEFPKPLRSQTINAATIARMSPTAAYVTANAF